MLPTIYIHQMTLAPWAGKIDMTDAAIVSLIRTLDPRNPRVKKLMVSDYFLLTTSYINEMLPLVVLGPDMLALRLKKLVRVGLVDKLLVYDKRTGHRRRYVKLSKLYYQAEERAEKKADSAVAGAREYSRMDYGRPTEEIRHDHNKVIKDRAASFSPAALPVSEPSAAALNGDVGSGARYDEEKRRVRREADAQVRRTDCPWPTDADYQEWVKQMSANVRGTP